MVIYKEVGVGGESYYFIFFLLVLISNLVGKGRLGTGCVPDRTKVLVPPKVFVMSEIGHSYTRRVG
jgi:hypothetical protein